MRVVGKMYIPAVQSDEWILDGSEDLLLTCFYCRRIKSEGRKGLEVEKVVNCEYCNKTICIITELRKRKTKKKKRKKRRVREMDKIRKEW